MSLLDKIKAYIGRRFRKLGQDESPDAEIPDDFFIERYRTMTDAERAETLEDAADQWEVENSEELDYKHSIVDLMKLTGQDFSLKHRKELAREVGWKGDLEDTAAMNEHLYPIVLKRLEIAY
jgi:hypothetical protein